MAATDRLRGLGGGPDDARHDAEGGDCGSALGSEIIWGSYQDTGASLAPVFDR
jgi:hypothetical protein